MYVKELVFVPGDGSFDSWKGFFFFLLNRRAFSYAYDHLRTTTLPSSAKTKNVTLHNLQHYLPKDPKKAKDIHPVLTPP
jgi:hypothetical protein